GDGDDASRGVGVAGVSLRHREGVVLLRDLTEELGLLAWNIDRALPREGRVVEVEHLVVERLQGTLRERDEPHRNVEAREPGGRLHEVREVLEVELDVPALPDTTHGGDEPDGRVRFDHSLAPDLKSR